MTNTCCQKSIEYSRKIIALVIQFITLKNTRLSAKRKLHPVTFIMLSPATAVYFKENPLPSLSFTQ